MNLKYKIRTYIPHSMLFSIAFLIIGLLFHYYISQTLVNNYKKNLTEHANHTSRIVESEIKRHLDVLETISSNEYIKSSTVTTDDKLYFLKKEAIRNDYKRLSIVDTNGNLKSTDNKQAYIGDRIYFKRALSGKKNVSDPINSRLDGTMVVAYAVPIKSSDKISGVLYAAQKADELCKIIESIAHQSNLSSFIINSNGVLIADKDYQRVLASENILENVLNYSQYSKLADYLKQMTQGKSNSGLYYYKGVENFIAFTPIKETDWSAAVVIPKNVAMKNANYFLAAILAFIILVFLLFVSIHIYTKYLRLKLSLETSTVNKVTDAANIIIIYLDLDGKILYFNKYAEEKTMYSKDDMINHKTIFDITPESNHQKLKSFLMHHSCGKYINGLEFSLKDKDGGIKTALWNIDFSGNLYRGNCDTVELIGIDITKRVEAENKLLESYEVIKNLAYYDSLTGLPNRYILYERVRSAVKAAAEDNKKGALVLIDLDNFKDINDSFGHSFGDLLLKEISVRLNSCNKGSDNGIFRLGGDEFIVLLENLDKKDQCNEHLSRIMNIFSMPITINGRSIHITSSIGISIFPDDSSDVEDLLRNSDSAMYYAKNKRKRKYMYFDKSMNDAVVEKMDLESKLRKAIENNEFILYYQPQINLKNGKIRGFEALIRWNSPDYGLVQPLKIIRVAEETGLIIPIGNWVLKTACKFNKHLLDNGYGNYCISVNISIIQLTQDDFVDCVTKILDETGLNPESLELEITESVLMESIEQCMWKLDHLRKMGIKLSLDDFGKGYSSFSYLKQLPVNVLKIDKSFIDDIGKNLNVTESIVHLGHKMGLGIIAEGVESSAQLDYLIKCNCNIVQGFFFSKPLPEKETVDFIGSFKFL